MRSVVLSIAGSDSCSGAGIQADLKTLQALGAYACTAITATTAQNTQGVKAIHAVSETALRDQINAVLDDCEVSCIKLGMLVHAPHIETVHQVLKNFSGVVIADPVMCATSGDTLSDESFTQAYIEKIIPHATLLTPNLPETQKLTGCDVSTYEGILHAAEKLIQFGAQSVLIKGGHRDGTHCSDYFYDGVNGFWVNQPRIETEHHHGTGCTLSAAIAGLVSQDHSLLDAIVLANALVHAGLRQPDCIGHGRNGIGHVSWPDAQDFPWVSDKPSALPPSCADIDNIGLYPLIDSLDALDICIEHQITCVQLRVKNTSREQAHAFYQAAIAKANRHGIRVFINDDWETAITLKTYGVHLGQEDLLTADLNAIQQAGLCLGVSAHNAYELARAYAANPSYLAMGPLFETRSKQLDYPAIGLEKLQTFIQIAPKPLVAIGGIQASQFAPLLAQGLSGVAFMEALHALV